MHYSVVKGEYYGQRSGLRLDEMLAFIHLGGLAVVFCSNWIHCHVGGGGGHEGLHILGDHAVSLSDLVFDFGPIYSFESLKQLSNVVVKAFQLRAFQPFNQL